MNSLPKMIGIHDRWRLPLLLAAGFIAFALPKTTMGQTSELNTSLGFGSLSLTNGINSDEIRLQVMLNLDRTRYYSLQQSSNLITFEPIRMTLGTGLHASNRWDLVIPMQGRRQLFWKLESGSISESADSDGDGLDDIFELRQPGSLDPTDPSDANQLAPGGTITWLQKYKNEYGRDLSYVEAISRETSVFNLERSPTQLESVSREVSIFNLERSAALLEAISREISVFNQERSIHSIEAISREVSVLNNPRN